MRLMGKQFIKDQPKITSGIDPVDWLPEELNWSGFRDAPTGHSKKALSYSLTH